MSKVIRLTESDLVNIVKKVINEQNKVSNDWMTNMKNSGTNTNVCPAGFVQMTQKEISAYDKQLVKPWANTTDGSGDYKTSKGGKIICKRVNLRGATRESPFKNLSLEQIVNGFRDAISGVGGNVAQIIISAMGAHVLNMVAWGLLVAYDIHSWVSTGTADWFNLLHDLFWLLLSGVGGKIMSSVKPLIKGESKLLTVLTKLSKTKSWEYIKGILSKLSSYGSKIITKISGALKLLISKIPSLKTLLTPLLNVINRVGGVLTTIENGVAETINLTVKKGSIEYAKGDVQGRALNAAIGDIK